MHLSFVEQAFFVLEIVAVQQADQELRLKQIVFLVYAVNEPAVLVYIQNYAILPPAAHQLLTYFHYIFSG